MLMRMNSPKGQPSDGISSWQTTMAWFDEGEMYPITVTVRHAVPSMEIIGVEIDYDKKQLEGSMGMRVESMITATALEEFTGICDTLRKTYLLNQKKKGEREDPLFED